MTKRHFTIYCDESVEKGEFYSDFYGGALVDTSRVEAVTAILREKATALNFYSEIKWTKVSERYLPKYIDLMDTFFSLISHGEVKIRIMYRQSAIQAASLTEYSKQHGYFLLYYQFIKHAFGLQYAPPPDGHTHLKMLFDELPDRKEKADLFKEKILDLQNTTDFQANQVSINKRDIGEVDSKDHIILQSLDVVLGSMAFRLNDKHKFIPPGQSRRGKKTIAKEKLYKHINTHIRSIYPGFNIGSSTGRGAEPANVFNHPYRHWSFKPKDFTIDESRFK